MGDYIVRAMSADGFVKAAAIRSTEIVRRGAAIQGTTTTATAAFGRALTATSLLGNMQKVEDGSVTLQIKGGGPLGTILCVSDSVGNVRGYVQHPVISLMEKYPGKLDVGRHAHRDPGPADEGALCGQRANGHWGNCRGSDRLLCPE